MEGKHQERYNAANERIKYKYRVHIKRALGKDEKTIIASLKHIRELEEFMGFISFKEFNSTVADKYITALIGRGISLSYINDNLRTLKEFLRWLERQKGYKSKINYNDIDYLNISRNQRNNAKASEYKRSYTFEQIFRTIRQMPARTLVERRTKAMISLQALCGLRINELRTVRMKNLIEEDGDYFIYVTPKDMEVKFAKSRQAPFMRLPKDIVDNVIAWRDYLTTQGFTARDPLFPQISNKFGQLNLLETRLTHSMIKSTTCIRAIFKRAFNAAGYDSPSFLPAYHRPFC
jgi:integrase